MAEKKTVTFIITRQDGPDLLLMKKHFMFHTVKI